MKSSFSSKIERVNILLHQIDAMNDQARLLMMLIEKEAQEGKE